MRRAWLFLLVLVFGVAYVRAQQRPRITGVAFLKVYSTKPDETQSFYNGLLGLERLEIGQSWIYPLNRTQWIEVLPHTPPPRTTDVFAGFGLTTVDAAAMERWLKGKGIAIAEALHDGQFSVDDPEGYRVTFVQSALVPKKTSLGGVPLAVSQAKVSQRAVSHRMIHVGLIVHDRAKEDAFYKTLLGFKPYWIGGSKPDRVDYVSQQVPDGHDWVEYMVSPANPPNLKNSGVLDHASLAVEHIEDALRGLARNGADPKIFEPMKAGVDSKVQLNVYDPNGTRIEFMDYEPIGKPCCTPFTASHPGPADPH